MSQHLSPPTHVNTHVNTYQLIIKRMKVHKAFVLRQLLCQRVGDDLPILPRAVVGKHDLGTVGARLLHLGGGRVGGHDDGAGYAELLGGAGETLGKVAGGEGHDAALLLVGGEVEHAVVRAPVFERPAELGWRVVGGRG